MTTEEEEMRREVYEGIARTMRKYAHNAEYDAAAIAKFKEGCTAFLEELRGEQRIPMDVDIDVSLVDDTFHVNISTSDHMLIEAFERAGAIPKQPPMPITIQIVVE